GPGGGSDEGSARRGAASNDPDRGTLQGRTAAGGVVSKDDAALPATDDALTAYLQALLDEVEEAGAEPAGDEAAGAAGGVGGAGEEDEPPSQPPRRSTLAEPLSPAIGPHEPVPDLPAAPTVQVRERERLPTMPLPSVAPPAPAPAPQRQPTPPPAAPPQTDQPVPAPRTSRLPKTARELGDHGGARCPPDDPVPNWARPWFQVLLFYVGPLRVAVPLVKLHRVLSWKERAAVEPVAGQPEWMHGALYHRDRYVQVVDTALLVLPPERRPEASQCPTGQLLIVGDGRWALACDRVGDVLRLTPDQVQWRQAAGRQRWLAGTVREQTCALLDTDAFAELLARDGKIERAALEAGDAGHWGKRGR
ncbi:hypothetical protein CKO15_11375, partial [Halorhodospira abdelmalekii]|uniref:chemotaxis protein CheW n=1 Tax=Halorhodospira abdelmalekii TaxID=421629 RepID=UPI001A92F65F